MLATAPLPQHNADLQSLSMFMAGEISTRVLAIGNKGVVYSPIAHPYHPYWLPASCEHPSTTMIEVVYDEEKGDDEMEM